MSERAFRRWLVAITAVGAAWRLAYLAAAKLGTPLLANDSLYFSIQAGRNSEGEWWREGLGTMPGAEHGPLYPLYLTPWSLGAGDNVDWQRFGTTLLGIATVAVAGLLGRRLAGPLVGLVAASIAALYPNLWINDSLVMSETLAVLLVTVALHAALGLDERTGLWRAALVGVLVGLAALTRSEVVLLAVGFAVLAWWRAPTFPRRALLPLVLIGSTVVTLAPWAVYNAVRFERPVLLTTNEGATIAGANCDLTYHDDVGNWDLRCLPIPPEGDASVRSADAREQGLDHVREHAGRLPVVVAARLGRMLDVYGLGSMVRMDRGEEKAGWAAWAGIVSFWVLAVAAGAGWWALRRDAGTRARRWWLAVPVLAVVVTSVLFYGGHRIRAPAEPAVVVLAAAGIVAAVGRNRTGAVADSPA